MVTYTPRCSYPLVEDMSLAGWMFAYLNAIITALDNNTAKCDWEAVAPPTTSDDEDAGYAVGSHIYDELNEILYICRDATADAAIWEQIWPVDASGLGSVLTDEGDMVYWDGAAVAPLHPTTKGYGLVSGGASAIPGFDEQAMTGWAPIYETLTYVSVDSPISIMMVTGDYTSKFRPQTKIRLVQAATTKYFTVQRSYFSSPQTYIVLDGMGVNDLANAAITSPRISFAYNPNSFPLKMLESWTGVNESVAYYSYDATIFTGVIRATGADLTDRIRLGTRLKWKHPASSWIYGLVTGITYSGGNTDITVFCSEALQNAAISGFVFSNLKCPEGFSLSPDLWSFEFKNAADHTQATPTQDLWYNPSGESFALPPGRWWIEVYFTEFDYENAESADGDMEVALALNADGSGDQIYSRYDYAATGGGHVEDGAPVILAPISLTAKTTYYFVMRTRTDGMLNIYSRNRQFRLISTYI